MARVRQAGQEYPFPTHHARGVRSGFLDALVCRQTCDYPRKADGRISAEPMHGAFGQRVGQSGARQAAMLKPENPRGRPGRPDGGIVIHPKRRLVMHEVEVAMMGAKSATEAATESQVPKEIDHLAKVVAQLQEIARETQARLAPVLRPEPEPPKAELAKEVLVPYAERLRDSRVALEDVHALLRDINTRLEI